MPQNVTLPVLHLASQSPRRKQLLEAIGIAFKAHLPKGVEELHPAADEVDSVMIANARAKARSISIERAEDVALGADTLVCLNNEVLGKPRDPKHATEILQKLSGKTQTVVTGLYLYSKKFGERSCLVKSEVTFKRLSADEISQYTQTREPYDKAGAYAVQGVGALFIEKIEGSYTNVMGLPIEAVMTELSALTHIPIFEWFR